MGKVKLITKNGYKPKLKDRAFKAVFNIEFASIL